MNRQTLVARERRSIGSAVQVLLLVMGLSVCGAALAAPRPLFTSEDPLKLRIAAPFDDLLAAAAHSTAPYEATLTLLAPVPEVYRIRLSARGISRRSPNTCDFPPLRIQFAEKPGATSVFVGQKTLKLATHCRKAGEFQNYDLLEYAAYKLLNVLTPLSFRVRMADIEYVEARTGNVRIHRFGFLVEDVGELAARNGLVEIKTDKIEREQLNASAAARSDIFQYMLGNQDWSDRLPPAGRPCCHNIKLLGASSADPRGLIPVAYDFDSSGFVNAPYALPPVGVPIPTVRVRNYRGVCEFNPEVVEVAHELLAKRAEVLASLDSTPYLAERSRSSAHQYLEDFFGEIGDERLLKLHILDKCRN